MARLPGTLVFVAGPSGAGKDSLLRYAANRFAGDQRFVFPRRVITRAADDGAENHDSASMEQFSTLLAQGRFALHWEAHGLHYGIPSSMDDDLARGSTVAVNVSRAILADAAKKYENHLIVGVTASAAVLAQRLALRGRESIRDIASRISRIQAEIPADAQAVTLVNHRALEEAGERFVALLYDTQQLEKADAAALG